MTGTAGLPQKSVFVALGTQKLFEELDIDARPLLERAEACRRDGESVILVAIDGRAAGLLGVADPIKASTGEAVKMLQQDGVRLVILTGDSRTTAEAVARKLGLDEIEAEVLPQDKVNSVKRLQAEGHTVAMDDGRRRHQ